MAAEVIGGSRWGTWVELLLAGAILRYGTRNWNQVAEELRARTVCPYIFTPEVFPSFFFLNLIVYCYF